MLCKFLFRICIALSWSTHTHTRRIYTNELLPPALCFRFPAENGRILPQSLAPHPWFLPPPKRAPTTHCTPPTPVHSPRPLGTPCLSLTFASLSLLFNFICFGRRRVYATHCNIEKFLCCHLPCPPYRPLAPLSPLSPLSPHFPPEFRLHSL